MSGLPSLNDMKCKRNIAIVASGLALCALTLPACEDDSIRSYTPPKPATVDASNPTPGGTADPGGGTALAPFANSGSGGSDQAASGKTRMLAAMAEHKEQVWFFKLTGPAEAVAMVAPAFESFTKSLKFNEDGSVSWTKPEGWEEDPPQGMRQATFHIDAGDAHLDMAVTKFPAVAQMVSVLANFNRWRGQLGLPPLTDATLAEATKTIETDGVTVSIMDAESKPAAANVSALPEGHPPVDNSTPSTPAGPAVPKRSTGVSFDVPEGWKEVADSTGMLAHVFESGGAKTSISSFPGDAGGIHANINRWRGQAGLDPVAASDIGEAADPASVGGYEGVFVNIVGASQQIVGVIVPTETRTWFFKMQGGPDAAGPQLDAFRAFVKSVRFDGREK